MRSGGGLFAAVLFGFLMIQSLMKAILYLKSPDKNFEATKIAAFILGYPFLVWHVIEDPSITVGVPVMLMACVFAVSGDALNDALAKPPKTKPGEFVGFPLRFWVMILASGFITDVISGKS